MLLRGCRWSRREDRSVRIALISREACMEVELIVGFYFAVQSGGDFEVDYTVMDPDDKVLLEGVNERQGDYIFTANKVCSRASGLLVADWK
jgi:hypothetical protein